MARKQSAEAVYPMGGKTALMVRCRKWPMGEMQQSICVPKSGRDRSDFRSMTKLDATFCYKLFDLKPGATQVEIKEAYRKLALQWHPDKYAHNSILQANAEEKFKIINAANDFLKTYNGSPQFSQPEQATRTDQNRQDAQEAERRKQEDERRRQKVQQEETERRRQQAERWRQEKQRRQDAEYKRQEAQQHEQERKKREAILQKERQKLKAEQPERERQERQEQWRKDEQERMQAQSATEAKTTHKHEPPNPQMREAKHESYHHFYQGKCLRCGRSRQSLAFYPTLPCS